MEPMHFVHQAKRQSGPIKSRREPDRLTSLVFVGGRGVPDADDLSDSAAESTVATAACVDHRCDHCAACRGGSCCRRDRPDWRLPELGSWSGPMFGQLGVLAQHGDLVECHICGQAFRMLASHVWRRHDVWADEYRAYFGLSAKRG